MQVVDHTATLMPNYDNDPQFNKKKRHIGNSFVAIVYNNNRENYRMGTIKGQFIYAHIINNGNIFRIISSSLQARAGVRAGSPMVTLENDAISKYETLT